MTDERMVTAGTVLLKIGDLEELEVEVDVLSQEVVKVKVGQPAEVFGPAIGNRPLHGIGQEHLSRRVHEGQLAGRRAAARESDRGLQRGRPAAVDRTAGEEGMGPGRRLPRPRANRHRQAARRRWSSRDRHLFRGADGNWQVFASATAGHDCSRSKSA